MAEKSDQINVFLRFVFGLANGVFDNRSDFAFLFGGYLIDKWLKTAPLFIVISIFAALAVSVYEILHLVRPMLENSRKELEEFTGEKKNNQS